MSKKLPYIAFEWQCGRCQTWNVIEDGCCKSCNAIAQQFAAAFRLPNKLTIEEDNFYKITAPQILNELREIKELLRRK